MQRAYHFSALCILWSGVLERSIGVEWGQILECLLFCFIVFISVFYHSKILLHSNTPLQKYLLFAHKIMYSMGWSLGVESDFGVAKVEWSAVVMCVCVAKFYVIL